MKKLGSKIKSFAGKCKRVWHTLKKPTKKEFETTAKVAALGILIIGTIGFAIAFVMKLFG